MVKASSSAYISHLDHIQLSPIVYYNYILILYFYWLIDKIQQDTNIVKQTNTIWKSARRDSIMALAAILRAAVDSIVF